MPTPQQRLNRLNEILTILEENDGKTTFGKLFSHMALKYGVTKNTFWSYLETLKTAGKIDYPEVFPATQESNIEIALT